MTMMNQNRDSNTGSIANPIVTFVSIIVFGVVIAVYIVKDEALIAPIILLSFIIGAVIAGFELKAVIRRREKLSIKNSEVNDTPHKEKLAKYVADLFDEEIPFDEISEDEKNGTLN